ncbi:MAG TPA: F0F1 ATP synthase subunit epsilon [Chthonomonadaceae bacterium]|nr:F0F1 ATP synthase subunit epsilon [Chthonomonadaceae bacterium]
MRLKVLLPFRVFAEREGVTRIVAETPTGSFGLLPHRLDGVAPLTPGILTYETPEEGEVYIAVDEGILVKAGAEVLVSVRNAIGGAELGRLQQTVEREFLNRDEREQNARYVLARLESDLTRRLVEFTRHG